MQFPAIKSVASIVLIVVLLPVYVLLSTWWNGQRSHPDSFSGLPKPIEWTPWHWAHVLDKPGFLVGYSDLRRNPLWVAYRVLPDMQDKVGARPKHFTIDDWTLSRVSADDYRHSGYDRGHMAPNYAMAKVWGRDAQLASFEMSNITPQKGLLNQKLWQRLEEIEMDVYAKRFTRLWVVTGPLFEGESERMASGVAIPDAFFRIWVGEDERGRRQSLAFIASQTVRGTEPLDRFVVSIDEVEERSGLDFFHLLEDGAEAAMESKIDMAAWDFARHAKRPPRY